MLLGVNRREGGLRQDREESIETENDEVDSIFLTVDIILSIDLEILNSHVSESVYAWA